MSEFNRIDFAASRIVVALALLLVALIALFAPKIAEAETLANGSCGDNAVIANADDGSYVVTSDQSLENIDFTGNIYIQKGVTLAISGTSVVHGDIYVLGTLQTSGTLTLSGTLYCLKYGSMLSAGNYDYGQVKATGSLKADSLICKDDWLATVKVPCVDHKYVETVSKAATCTQAGTKTLRCSICSHTETASIPALGHNPGNWVEQKKPTTSTEGLKVRTCTRCGLVLEQQSIPKLAGSQDSSNSTIGGGTVVATPAPAPVLVKAKAQAIKIKKASKTVSLKTLKKKAATYTFTVSGNKTPLTYVKLTKAQKKWIKSVKISGSKVKITLKKGVKAKKVLKISVYAKAKGSYKQSTKKAITIRIK